MGLFRKLPNNRLFHSSSLRGEGVALGYIGSQWMVDKAYVEPGELEYLAYKEYAEGEYDELLQSFADSSVSAMDSARSLGVQREWEAYQLFAELGAPQDTFTYVDDDGSLAVFSEQEIEQIRTWDGEGPYPISGIEGHHLHTVRDNPDNLELAADPDNIMLATREGHLQHLHGGSTLNPTQSEYMDRHRTLEEMFQDTLEHQHDLMVPGLAQAGLATVVSSVALYTSVSMLLECMRLRRDPRPWLQKKDAMARTLVSTLVSSSVLAASGFGASLTVNAMFAGVAEDMLATAFDEILAMNASFAAVAVTAGFIKYRRDLAHGRNRAEAMAEFRGVMFTAAAEMAAFQALGVGIEMLGDLLLDAASDALIPDFTGGFIVVSRMSYSLFKAGKKLYDGYRNKQAHQTCRELRLDSLYAQAQQQSLPPNGSHKQILLASGPALLSPPLRPE